MTVDPRCRLLWPILGIALVVTMACAADEQPAAPSAPPPSISGTRQPIVLITIDTLRADHLGTYGYFRDTSPRIDELGRDGVVFEKAYAPIGTTLPSHVSLFTGLYPLQTGVVMNGMLLADSGTRPVALLSEMLRGLDYATAGFISAAPVRSRTGIDAGMDVYGEPPRDEPQRTADATTDEALAWLEQQQDPAFFLWVHYFDPHSPYEPPAAHAERYATDADGIVEFQRQRGVPEAEMAEMTSVNNAYDGEIRFVDTELGRLIDALRARGWYDPATLVVTSDHGEGLGQHERVGHGKIYQEILHVPLIMKMPADFPARGERRAQLVSLIDVVPTLVDSLSLPVSEATRAQFEGSNVFDAARIRDHVYAQRTFRERPNQWGMGQKFALITADWKYHFSTEADDELYDLRADPHELNDALAANVELGAELKATLEALIERFANQGQLHAVQQDDSEETLRELRALGYIQ